MSTSPTTTEQPIVDERKTKELCGIECNGLRCIRAKGHVDEHAAYTAVDTVLWKK